MPLTGLSDEKLMKDIRAQYGAAIRAAVAGTNFPESLLAALIANESGGDMGACRFEPSVLWQMAFVLIGRKTAFGAITTEDLSDYIPKFFLPRDATLALVNLSSSWGLTQIMGYQALAGGYAMAELSTTPELHLKHAVDMLTSFQKAFHLPAPDGPVARDYFHCWNAGRPNAPTKDPDYPDNGWRRMSLYESSGEQHA